MSSMYLTEEHEEFRREVRACLTTEVLPYIDDWEEARCIPKETWKVLGEKGYLGLHHPRAYGGRELDVFYSVAFLEELGRMGYGGFRSAVAMHSYMASQYVGRYASEYLKSSYLASMVSGERVATLAASEPEAGSDLAGLVTAARRDGEAFILDGRKSHIANGTFANLLIVPVRVGADDGRRSRDPREISLVVVDTNWKGVKVAAQGLSSWRCAGMATIELEGVAVPADHVIGNEGKGFAYLMHTFQFERLVAAIIALGGAQHTLEHTVAFLKRREVYGRPLADRQHVRHGVAEMATHLEAARQLVYHSAAAFRSDDWAVKECSMAKLFAGDLSLKVAQECLQLHGAQGCMEDSVTMRALRDGVGTTIAAGASEVMRDIIAGEILG